MTELTKISAKVSTTINLGDYNSVKIELGVEDAVRTDEKAPAAVDRVYKLIETKLAEKAADFNERWAQLDKDNK